MSSEVRTRYHIAQVTPYYRPCSGGITSFVTGLCDGLERNGFDCSVVCNEGDAAARVRVAKGPKLVVAFRTFAHLAALRPDLVHVHGHWYLMLGALAYSRLFRTPSLLTTHTDKVPDRAIKRRLLSWLMNRFDYVVSVSHYIQKVERQNFRLLRPKCSVVYAGIDIPAEHITIRDRPTRLIAVCLFAWEAKTRGVALLARSMKSIVERYPDVRLDIIGDGPYRHIVEEAIAEVDGNGFIRLLGAMSRSEVRDHLLRADIFVHISLQEALAIAILEAMSAGLPIVANPVGGIPEVLKDGVNSIHVQPDCGSIAEGVSMLLADKALRSRLHERCLRDVQHFSWDASIASYADIYRQAAEHRYARTRLMRPTD